jgi:glycosyltransferase involved in cell wall biosynthesis
LKAFSLLIKTHKSELIIVGQGSYVSSGKKLAKALGIYSHCHFIGWVQNPSQLISKSDVFVTAPIFEGFGNSIIEAMRSKTPVVSTDAPFGPSEILENGKNGILVPVGDDIKFSSAIAYLLDNPSKSKELAKIAHKSLIRFDPKLIASKWGEVLGLNE